HGVGQRTESGGFLLTVHLRIRIGLLFPCSIHRSALRRRNRLRDFADKFFKRWSTRSSKSLARHGYVHIEISFCVSQFLSMVFSPFSGTHQPFFFRVPASDHDRAFRLPS